MAHMFPDGSWGVRVQGAYKKRKENPPEIDKLAGDGRYGYRTRPRRDSAVLTTAWDGQEYLRSGRKSAVGKQKSGCRLASRGECRGVDPLIVQLRNQAKAGRRSDLPRFRARKGQKPSTAL